ncbi:hypothetical protein GIB67_041938 [Kingdonia uniflora]|uniref:Uncharacterized protein n=1 Tax=Kingdonia uniflora TaxID=39325 RepID=A0A7J7N1F6_9MAGN|nr:hypothetical protein GIB67_041938 [Kingdonia uniflora]
MKSSSKLSNHNTSLHRKVLMEKFDFIQFQKHHHHPHHHRHQGLLHQVESGEMNVVVVEPEPEVIEIDPRYGVDKRLVPTGPNPLHH